MPARRPPAPPPVSNWPTSRSGCAAALLLYFWRDWLALQRLSLDGVRHPGDMPPSSSGARIELADLKERVRKLEAIAAGVEL